MRVAAKFAALAFLGVVSNSYAHELRGAIAVTDIVPLEEMDEEMDGEDRNRNNNNRSNNNRNNSLSSNSSRSSNNNRSGNNNRGWNSRRGRNSSCRGNGCNFDYGRGRTTNNPLDKGTHTDRGKSRYRRSNSTNSGYKRSAAGKREDRRARRRADRNNDNGNRNKDCRNRNCLIEEVGLHPEDADIMADFFEKYDEEDIEFISDFLFDEMDFVEYEDEDFSEDYGSEE